MSEREQRLERRASRERRARKEAERLLEQKSLELYEANAQLRELTQSLEAEVEVRTKDLKRAVRERDILLQEVHHRVKNNLQIIASLLSLQSQQVGPELEEPLRDSIHRVHAMALVHEQLYSDGDFEALDLGAYISNLSRVLRMSLLPDDVLAVTVEQVVVPVATAIPLGLIFNELLSNALKHGRSPSGQCRIMVSVKHLESAFELAVRDQGPGFTPAQSPSSSRKSLGTKIIDGLCRQLSATLSYEYDEGLECIVRVPIEASL